ncbi:hypothetical protein HIM_08685 [Hirsutella minnesotensis 3608]|uniref:Uncharacterized protein n=1 Tax=Hirsutella minnesotensis 3608 TaxID=1043627 RepID=A0A0F8A3J3_9HYPO|nr:hypothetical protein HIM_08685 [Hirsutella minnesotensis 3608]
MASTVNATSDASFGPQLADEFDFTLLFEQTILSILPDSLFITASPIYLAHLLRKSICARSGILLWVKLTTAFCLFGIQVALAGLWRKYSLYSSSPSLAAALLSCVGAVCIAAVLVAEHRHSTRPSTLLSVFLSISTLHDVAISRSFFRRPGLYTLGCVNVASALFKAAIVVLEEVPKTSLLRRSDETHALGKESTSGFWSRSLFLWLNSTLLLGFRNIINTGDLQELGPDFSSRRLYLKFEPIWSKADKTSPRCLAKACFRTLMPAFFAVVIPRLCFLGIKFAQPFLLQRIISAIGQREQSREIVGGLVGATVLIYFGIAISKAYYKHLTYRMITMLRGVLVSAIFKKSLRLRQSDKANESAAVTLMSTDIDGIEGGLDQFHDIWASVLELALGVYLLATIVGGASFLVVLPGLITMIASVELARRMAPARVSWNEKVQARVSAMSNVLSQMKSIKMTGLTPVVSEYIQGLRVVEVNYSKKLRLLLIIMHAIASFSTSLTPIVVIAGGLFWTKFSNGLDASQIFSTLSIIALVSEPLVALLVAYPTFAGILGCFARIETFLLTDERSETRLGQRGQNNDTDECYTEDKSRTQSDAETTPVDEAASLSRAVQFQNASIAAAEGLEPILKDVNLALLSSSITMVVGPVGTGKSTLLKGILGEVNLVKGSVFVKDSSIAYCGQCPWLRNVSMRDNIVGHSDFDADWYHTVVEACLLDEDARQLAHGDETCVGSAGVNLSGGQRQRVALARAVYSRKSLLLLDDVFSALDRPTSRAVFARLFGEKGVLRLSEATVIIATHSVEYLTQADEVILIDEAGNVLEQHKPEVAKVVLKKDVVEAGGKSKDVAASAVATSAAQTREKADKGNLERQRGDLSLYAFYIKSIGYLLFGLWLCTVALSAVADKTPQIFIRIWLEKNLENKAYFAGFAVLGVSSLFFSSVMLAFYLLKLVPKSAESLHWMLLDRVMRATLCFLTSTDSGSLVNRFSQDMTLVSQVLPMAFMQVAYLAFSVLADIGIIASGAKYASATIIPFFAVTMYYLQRFYLRTSRQIRYLDLEAKSPLYTQFTETAAGLHHIRAFGWVARTLTDSLELLDYSQKPYYYMFCIQRWLELILDLCILVIAVVLVSFALTTGSSEAAIGLALVNVITLGEALSQLIKSWIDLETSLGAIARLRTFLQPDQTPVEEEDDYVPETQVPPGWPAEGAVELRALSASYSATSRPVLNDISTAIRPGQKVGIIGRTGSGKSSLLSSILGLLSSSGVVRIDGVDLSQISRQQLRSCITTLPQDPVQLAGSIRDNLDPFRTKQRGKRDQETDESAMVQALVRVDLWPHVSSHGGLDADLGSLSLSHGQKQLLCLARAILHNAQTGSRVVLIDEATSNLDEATDKRIQTVLSSAFAGCTQLVVAHRLDTVRDADIIVEMDGGRIVNVTQVNK